MAAWQQSNSQSIEQVLKQNVDKFSAHGTACSPIAKGSRDAFCLLDRLDFSRGGYLEESVGSGRSGRGHDFILQIALPPPLTEPPLHF